MSQEVSAIVRVELGPRGYDIEIGQENLSRLGAFLATRMKLAHAVVITDATVGPRFALQVEASLRRAGARVDVLTVPAGESSKAIERVAALWDRMLDVHADRQSVVVALGGGVVGDLAGFIAATFARGLPFVQVPTTLLAQVDSSVGGKVGVNLPRAKNMVGAIWQPAGVLIDTDVLSSLPDREYRAGLAEVVKYGVILDADFFAYFEQHAAELNGRAPDILRHVIARCCQLKADVVAADERDESGKRAVLNYGHTFGHALEATAGYGEYLHGEAVAIGMMCAARLAVQLGRVGPEFVARQQSLLKALALPIAAEAADVDQILAAMQHDKKTLGGRLSFVLPLRMGAVEMVAGIAPELVRDALRSD